MDWWFWEIWTHAEKKNVWVYFLPDCTEKQFALKNPQLPSWAKYQWPSDFKKWESIRSHKSRETPLVGKKRKREKKNQVIVILKMAK